LEAKIKPFEIRDENNGMSGVTCQVNKLKITLENKKGSLQATIDGYNLLCKMSVVFDQKRIL